MTPDRRSTETWHLDKTKGTAALACVSHAQRKLKGAGGPGGAE